MSKWEMVRLGDVCERKVQSLPANSDFEIVYIDIASIDNTTKKMVSFRVIDAKNAPSRAKQVLKKNDIIVSTVRPNLNAVAIVTQESDKVVVGSTGYCVLRCTDEAITEYIFYFCQSKKFIGDLVKVAKGASYPAVSDNDVKDIQIPLPPIEVQKKIAQTLDTVAELIALRKKQLAELDNLIKSTFYDMFGDPVTNEKGWEVVRLGNTLNIIGGFAFRSEGFQISGVPVIKIGNINSGKFVDEEISFWAYDEKLERFLLHPKDIVISLTGTVGKDDYANVCILPDKYPQYYLNQRNAKLELSNELDVMYLLYLLKDHKIKGQLTGISRGIRQANISNSDILSLLVPLPPLSLQTQFAEIVTKIEEQKALVQQAIDESQYLFDSLMNEYFG